MYRNIDITYNIVYQLNGEIGFSSHPDLKKSESVSGSEHFRSFSQNPLSHSHIIL